MLDKPYFVIYENRYQKERNAYTRNKCEYT